MTGNDNYFEDFKTGDVFRHARGKTVTVLENVFITNMVMNTAQAHFNEHMMRATEHGGVVSFGGVQLSLVLGLSSQDCCENAIAELGLDRVRFASTVAHGTTIYAVTEVLETRDSDRPDAGIVVFRHYGLDGDGRLILEAERRALIKRRAPRGA
jgi:acyl dehydratase